MKHTFNNKLLVVSNAAMRELMAQGETLDDVLEILTQGVLAPRKRKKGTIEKWLVRKNKISNAVVVASYHAATREDCYVLTHVGRFTKK